MFFGKYQSNVAPNFQGLVGGIPTFTADYGANWATTSAINADLALALKENYQALLINTNGTGGGTRQYLYNGTAWKYVALT